VARQAATPGSSEFRRKLGAAPAKQRRPALVAHVRDEVARVMGLPAADAVDLHRGLFDMGMDSLMALELRTRLQASLELEIPATVAFEFPTIEAIAGFLGDKLGLDSAASTVVEMPRRERAERHPDALEKVLQLSDEDVERQLEQRLRERKSVP
jgi:acyl carrier protein